MTASNKLNVIQSDITTLEVDAVVNAANSTLLGGGGVDGAIHQAAGPQLLEACSKLGGCPTGQAKITRAYRLPSKYVIHTVGPVWSNGHKGEAEMLASCYRESMILALQHNIETIAFPAISCGVYGYPLEQAAKIGIDTLREFIATKNCIRQILLTCFSDDVYTAYSSYLNQNEQTGSKPLQ